jgi:signal transduction histidine kinase
VKPSFLGKLLERVEHLGADELQRYLIRLARENGLLERIFNTLQDGVVVLDGEGKVEYANGAARRMLPLPKDGGLGAPMERFLRDVPWRQWVREAGGLKRRLEISYPEARVVEVVVVPLGEGEEGGGSGSRVAVFHDVTQAESRTREAIQSEREQALTLLAAEVAHELGNPLNSLHIHLQLIQRDLRRLPDDAAAPMRESITVALRELERLDGIIHQFLRAIRPTAPDFAPCRIGDLIEETLQTLGPEMEDRGLLVESEIDPQIPDMVLDAGQMKQVFYNLARNAMQAVDGRGLLRIRAERDGDTVVVSFQDNGCGISLEDLPRVTEPYFTTKSGGSGLGLMIVQRIVREHGGMMEIESQRGKGTTVRLRFPVGGRQVRLLEAP